jgi:hypothetical protein
MVSSPLVRSCWLLSSPSFRPTPPWWWCQPSSPFSRSNSYVPSTEGLVLLHLVSTHKLNAHQPSPCLPHSTSSSVPSSCLAINIESCPSLLYLPPARSHIFHTQMATLHLLPMFSTSLALPGDGLSASSSLTRTLRFLCHATKGMLSHYHHHLPHLL